MSFLQQLRDTNIKRCARWHGPDTEAWTGADWSNAMCGEAGEAANVVKKLRRHETRTGAANSVSVEVLRTKLGAELADTLIYADLLAHHYGIDLQAAVVAKFNFVSEREGFPERLHDDRETA
jgi:NTP pyrophosphatase (non-canonical NTP hydrolase)